MKLMQTYLWKEWRDHRSVLIGMLVAVPVLMAVAGFSLPTKAFEDRTFAMFTALACLAIFVFSLTTDLAPGESRRGTLGFLRRVPAGLGAAFGAKLLLLVAGTTLFTAYGYVCGAVTTTFVHGSFPAPALKGEMSIVLVFALWIFAISCCLPRGVLALPATVALAVLLCAPLPILAQHGGLRGADMERWWSAPSLIFWIAGAILAAWLAFVRARRHGGGSFRALRGCLAVAFVCAMPYWADAGMSARHWFSAATPQIHQAFVDPDGRFLYVNRVKQYAVDGRYGHVPPLVLDLETGARWTIDEKNSIFSTVAAVDRGGWWHRSGQAQTTLVLWGPGTARLLDCATGEMLGDYDADRDASRVRAAKRATAPYRLSDGRRVWHFGGKLECDAPDGGVQPLDGVTPRDGFLQPCGLGLSWNRRAYYDFARAKTYARRDLPLRGHNIRIRPGKWIVFKLADPKKRGNAWQLLDPDTGVVEPAQGLDRFDDLCAIHDDGRLFVLKRDKLYGEPTALWLLDPESGAHRVVGMPESMAHPQAIHDAGRLSSQPVRAPDGRRVFKLVSGHRQIYGNNIAVWDGVTVIARFDEAECRLVAAGPGVVQGVTLLGCVGEDEAFVLAGAEQIWRVRFGSDAYELVYFVE